MKIIKNLLLPSGPLFLVHFVTNDCNAHCQHCFIYSLKDVPKKYTGKTLSLEEIKKTAKSLKNSLVNVSLTGGEPFLNPDLPKIVNLYCREAKVTAINITTNASLSEVIFRSVNQMLKDNPNLRLTITMSVDEIGVKHDANRNFPGLFAKMVKTYTLLRSIKSTRLTLGFNLTVTPKNEANLKKIYQYLTQTLKADNVSSTALRFGPRLEGATFDPKEYKKLNRMIEADLLGKKLSGQKGFIGSDIYNAKTMLMHYFVEKTLQEKRCQTRCQAGRMGAILNANGDVYPCELLEQKIGNLKDFNYDFPALWRSMEAKNLRKYIKNTKCFCTYECFLGLDFLANPKYYPQLLNNYLKIKTKRS
jgi:MoaA/NifB/PqqE/SkfB family radical SAM enzyme